MEAPAAAAPDAPADRARLRHSVLLAAAVATVVVLFTVAHLTDRPLFLVRPPITRWVACCKCGWMLAARCRRLPMP